MRILLVTPARRGSRNGNRVTALRWARLLRSLGHPVALAESYRGERCDVLVALHARKSLPSIERFHAAHPAAPIVVALTGTDLYEDLPGSPEARRALELASRLVTLQPLAVETLPAAVRSKARSVIQSARPPASPPPRAEGLQVCVLAHLREVKDPFLCARALRRIPASSVRVVHCGMPLDPGSEARARAAERDDGRWRWAGALSRAEALCTLAASRALVVSSRLEGGSNAVSEAIACGVPVLSTRIEGSLGVLGADYPGLYPVGDDAALAALLVRLEVEPAFEALLRRRIDALRPLVEPSRERSGWRALLAELAPGDARPGASAAPA